MIQSLVFAIGMVVLLSSPLQAQELSDGFSQFLKDQGFVVVSKRYTWLGRVAVNASNGVYEREILITRGSNQMLQDNWVLIETDPPTNITRKPARIGGERNGRGGGPGPGPGPEAGPAGSPEANP